MWEKDVLVSKKVFDVNEMGERGTNKRTKEPDPHHSDTTLLIGGDGYGGVQLLCQPGYSYNYTPTYQPVPRSGMKGPRHYLLH